MDSIEDKNAYNVIQYMYFNQINNNKMNKLRIEFIKSKINEFYAILREKLIKKGIKIKIKNIY